MLRHLLLLTLIHLLCTSPSHACSCIPPSLLRTYYAKGVVSFVRAKVLKVLPPKGSGARALRRFKLRLQQNYKGCPPDRTFFLFTRRFGASCGVFLQKGVSYLLPVRRGRKPMIFLCDFISQPSDLSSKDRRFLRTRNVCCKGSCMCASGLPQVRCIRRPCSPPEKPPCKDAVKCVDNYCGGCFAEWFEKNRQPACTPDPFN